MNPVAAQSPPHLPSRGVSGAAAGHGALRPNPNPQRPHRPPDQHVDLHDASSTTTTTSTTMVMPTETLLYMTSQTEYNSPPPSGQLEPERNAFITAVLGAPTPHHKTEHMRARRVPFPTRPTRRPDNTPAPFGPSALPSTLPHPPRRQPAPKEPGLFADCSPWTGKHNEDKLSEQAVKFGYTQKQRFPSEGNTARHTICPHISKGSGLQALSSLFTAVVAQRRDASTVSAPSTFRLPPRVALTDSKREAWLRDWANPTFPLRRLSRTIPHGVRGKTLLEQCQSKSVDMDRAVWLVRCVGANDLRAFRRKGISTATSTGNGVKWIKEWTATVESFVDDAFASETRDKARPRLSYALQLAVRLYDEKLLDRHHFLDWLMGLLERCPPSHLLLACIFVRVFWRRLAADCALATRLVAACAQRLGRLSKADHAPAKPAVEQLESIVVELLTAVPTVLIFGTSWSGVRPALVVLLDSTEAARVRHAVRATITRNDRLKSLTPPTTPSPDPVSALVELLSLHDYSESMQTFATKCSEVVTDKVALVTTALRFATFAAHTGTREIYLSASLIRAANMSRAELTETAVRALSSLRHDRLYSAARMSALLQLFTDSDGFDVARYLRWIMTAGALNGLQPEDLDSSFASRFVRDVAAHSLDSGCRNTRRMLLQGIRAYQDEDVLFSTAREAVISASKQLRPQDVPSGGPTAQYVDVRHLHMPVRKRLADWVLQDVKEQLHANATDAGEQLRRRTSDAEGQLHPKPTNAEEQLHLNATQTEQERQRKQHAEEGQKPSISGPQFIQARLVVEAAEAPIVLLHLVETLTPHADMDLLVHLLDSMSAHRDVAKVLGRFDLLLVAVYRRYRTLRTRNPPSREVLWAMARLADRPRYNSLKSLLAPEIDICNQIAGAVAYTPASDTMEVESDPLEAEMERLMSGTVLDGGTVGALFNVLRQHAKLNHEHTVAFLLGGGQLLARLMDSAPSAFSTAMSLLLADMVRQANEPNRLVSFVVGHGFIRFSEVLVCLADQPQRLQQLVQEALSLAGETYTSSGVSTSTNGSRIGDDAMDRDVPTGRDSSRIGVDAMDRDVPTGRDDSSVATDPDRDMLTGKDNSRIATDGHVPTGRNDSRIATDRDMPTSREAYCYATEVRDYVAKEPASLLRLLLNLGQSAPRDSTLGPLLDRTLLSASLCAYVETRQLVSEKKALIYKNLDPHNSLESLSNDALVEFLFQRVNEMCLPLYRLAIDLLPAKDDSFCASVAKATQTAIAMGRSCWADLARAADPAVSARIREQAEGDLSKALVSKPDMDMVQEFERRIEGLVSIVTATAYSVGEERHAHMASSITGQMRAAASLVLSQSTSSPRPLPPAFDVCMTALLRLVLVHRQSFVSPVAASDLNRLLYACGVIIGSRSSSVSPATLALVTDVCGYLVTYCPATTAAGLRRSLERHTSRQTTTPFLFGADDTQAVYWHVKTSIGSVNAGASSHSATAPSTPQQLQVQQQTAPFVLRPFEMLPDSTPNPGPNDTALSLRLFGARQER